MLHRFVTNITNKDAGREALPIVSSERHPHPVRLHTHVCKIARELIAEQVRGQPSPSDAAKCSTQRAIQKESNIAAIRNGRPANLSGPPIQIYHPAFATFIRESLDTAAELTPEILNMAGELIGASLDIYPTELQRKEALEKLTFWESIFTAEYALDTTAIRHDGSTSASCSGLRIPIQIVELKNEIGQGGSDPITQAERCHATIICSTRVGLSSFFPNLTSYSGTIRSTVQFAKPHAAQ